MKTLGQRGAELIDKLNAWHNSRSLAEAADICDYLVFDRELCQRMDEDHAVEHGLIVWQNTRSLRTAADICGFLSSYYPERWNYRAALAEAVDDFDRYMWREGITWVKVRDHLVAY